MSSSDTAAALDTAIPLLAWYAFNGAFNANISAIVLKLLRQLFLSPPRSQVGVRMTKQTRTPD